MNKVFIIGKDPSKIYKIIHKKTGIPIYKGENKKTVDIIINYGVTGKTLHTFFETYPSTNFVPMLNKFIGRSKFLAIKDAQKSGILVPDTKLKLSNKDKLNDWIEKKLHSNKGIGIKVARKKDKIIGKYYQKIITPKRYEIRVHAFNWLPKEEWAVQKRIGPTDQIAWNFHQGGHFITIHNPILFSIFKEAIDITEKILKIRKMSFGAVDFIVSQDLKVYFIEINSAPGFSNLSAPIYINAFNKLKTANIDFNW